MPRKLPPLNALRAFEAAARLGSFTRAAAELHVTHGAVSRQVKLLEDYLEQPVFQRIGGGVQLNAVGRDYFDMARDVLDRVEQTTTRLRRRGGQMTLSINVTAAFAALWLIPRLTGFQQAYPDITVNLMPNRRFEGFAQENADLAIRWGTASWPEVAMERLLAVDTFAACSPTLLVGDTPLRSPEDLRSYKLIHDDDGAAWRVLLSKMGIADYDIDNGRFYADSLLALQAAVAGQGVIAAGSVLAAQELAAGRLVLPFDTLLRGRNAYYLYYPKARSDDPHITAFRNWIAQEAAAYVADEFDPLAFQADRP